jgi:Ca-activated chloride channel family protein
VEAEGRRVIAILLLLAAPERVVLVAKPKEAPSVIARVGEAFKSAGRRLYERTDPDVDQGNALAGQNDPEGALKAYDRALERMPDNHRLHYDRAGQLLKMGSDHATQARDEALQAMQTDDRPLKASASFDEALAQEAMGQPDEAIKSYERTLALDPDDEDAKVNLELLLKTQEERKQKQQQQQQQSQQKNEKPEQKPDPSKGNEQQKQQQKEAGQKEKQKEEPQQGPQQQAKQEEKKQQVAQEEKPVDRSEAERLLDALRAGEKNLQVWRFAKEKRKEARRGDVEKDW